MKHKIFITIALVMGITFSSYSQQNSENKKKANRITFLTKVLRLTPEESDALFPLLKQKREEKKEKISPLRKSNRANRKKLESLSDQDINQIMENMFTIRQIELDIDKKYHQKLLDILPAKKVAKLYHIEKRFRKHKKEKGKRSLKEEKRQEKIKILKAKARKRQRLREEGQQK